MSGRTIPDVTNVGTYDDAKQASAAVLASFKKSVRPKSKEFAPTTALRDRFIGGCLRFLNLIQCFDRPA